MSARGGAARYSLIVQRGAEEKRPVPLTHGSRLARFGGCRQTATSGAGKARTSKPPRRRRPGRRSPSGESCCPIHLPRPRTGAQARPGSFISARSRSSRLGSIASTRQKSTAAPTASCSGSRLPRRRPTPPTSRSRTPRICQGGSPKYHPVCPPTRRMGRNAAAAPTGTWIERQSTSRFPQRVPPYRSARRPTRPLPAMVSSLTVGPGGRTWPQQSPGLLRAEPLRRALRGPGRLPDRRLRRSCDARAR